jgi:MYXO-CTERM domain-containing protein
MKLEPARKPIHAWALPIAFGLERGFTMRHSVASPFIIATHLGSTPRLAGSLLTGALVMLLCSPALAVTLTNLHVPYTEATGAKSAEQLVLQYAESLGARSPELRFVGAFVVPQGQVFRFQQVAAGHPVFDANVAVLGLKQHFVALSGQLWSMPDSVAESLLDEATLTVGQVSEAVQRAYPRSWIRGSQKLLLADAVFGQRAVWQMNLLTRDPFGLYLALVDGRTGQLLWKRSTMHRVAGQFYTTNPTVGTLVVKPLAGLTGKEILFGEYADVSRCILTDTALQYDRLASPNESGNYLFIPSDPDLNDPFAEVQAYYHVDTFHRWLQKNFGFSRKGNQQIKVFVNFQTEDAAGVRMGYSNAFSGDITGDNKTDLVFGEDLHDFAYDGDVIYHEFTHSVVGETSDLNVTLDELGLNGLPAALNEGFADLFSGIFTRDAVIGDYAGEGGIRSLEGHEGCSGSLIGESHNDGQVWGQANWSVRAKVAQKATYDQILYTTMVSLDSAAGYTEATALLRQVTQEIDPALLPLVDGELKTRKMDQCSRILTMKPSVPMSGFLFNPTDLGLTTVPASFQYKIDVPPEALALRITFKSGHGQKNHVGAYVRRGESVLYKYKTVTYDILNSPDQTELDISLTDKEYPLVPGSSYYLLPVNDGNFETMYRISYEIDLPTPPQPDAGVVSDLAVVPPRKDGGMTRQDGNAPGLQGNDSTGGEGCSCTLGASPGPLVFGPMMLGAFILIGAGLLRRRRRA